MTAALDSLHQTVQALQQQPSILDLPLDLVHPDPDQPRKDAAGDRQSLEELAESFKTTNGPVQPILVEPHPFLEGQWQIVAGERRFLAAALAGFSVIRAIPLPRLDEEQRLVVQLVENDQREDLDLLSRATAYERLLKVSKKKPGTVARALGISASAFSNMLRVLRASDIAQQAIVEKLLTNPEVVRLFDRLPDDSKKRLLAGARTTGAPISRVALERAVENIKPAPSPGEPPAPAAPPRPHEIPGHEQDLALEEEEEDADVPVALPPLAARHLRRLFDLLSLPFPDDPREAPSVLLDFLTGAAP